ncbi:HesA/MoeB/ThiF family protein [Candidatus Woesearchaeota archaeon]|nr:HesA/MoeB/ThiF family protein [Candidatus Woesearchaeota archaeon]
MSTYYLRQNAQIGEKGTKKLKESKVIIVGLGGLGSGVAQILGRMGVGEIVLVDNDVVQEHNLSRQQLYTINDVNKSKVSACKAHLLEINPNISVEIIEKFADKDVLDSIKNISCIVDCTDRHESRRIIDSFCLEKNIPWVHGAAIREQGVVCVFGPDYSLKSYEDIYKGKNVDEFCEGVIATTTNVISSLQASLVIKILLKKNISKGLFRVNLDTWEFESINISK